MMEIISPAGPERWLEEIAVLAAGGRRGFEAFCARHHIAFFPESPRIARLRRRFILA